MGTVLRFPAVSSTSRDPNFQALSLAIPDFVRQLQSFQKLAVDSLSETFEMLETALADIDAIGRLLPPGEFKTQFDLDRRALAMQTDLTRGKTITL